MCMAPAKIIFMVILSFEVARVSLQLLQKSKQGKFCNFTINRNHSNKK